VIIKNRIESEDQWPKLALRKETLRQLTDMQLREVAGGMGMKILQTNHCPARTQGCPKPFPTLTTVCTTGTLL
jgi:hypothetical protein